MEKWKSIKLPEEQYNKLDSLKKELQKRSVGEVHLYHVIDNLFSSTLTSTLGEVK